MFTGNVSIGHIGKEMFSNLIGGERWKWYLKLDDNTVPPGCMRRGEAATYEEARAAVEHNWLVWLNGSWTDREKLNSAAVFL